MSELPEPHCKDCLSFQPDRFDDQERIVGTCRFRPELGEIPETLPWCDEFRVKPSRYGLVAEPVVKRAAGAPRGKGSSHVPGRSKYEDVPAKQVAGTLQRPVTGDTGGEIAMDRDGLKQVIRELLEEETMYGYVPMAERWNGGKLEMQPGDPELQSKTIDIDIFFHKVTMLRDRLRVLEQKINSNKSMSEGEKVDLQQYISKCYGSLTSFNVLFKDRDDWFKS